MNTLPGITISGLQLSDLFFNAEHPHYDEACAAEDDPEAALLLDANEFSVAFLGGQVPAQTLADDFFARL